MREKGFVNHTLMGALFLGAMWLALYLPSVGSAIRQGGWPVWLTLTVFLVGWLAGPALMIAFGGDEIMGCLGILAALLAGWIGARLAASMGVSGGAVEAIRLCGAALGPIVLYGGFHLAHWLSERRA